MENNKSARDESPSVQSRPQLDPDNLVAWVLNAFILLVIEIDFFVKLVHLIRAHAPLWYISSATVVQFSLVMAAITYRHVRRMLSPRGFTALNREKLQGKIGYMAMCLLFALMFYENYAADAARANQ